MIGNPKNGTLDDLMWCPLRFITEVLKEMVPEDALAVAETHCLLATHTHTHTHTHTFQLLPVLSVSIVTGMHAMELLVFCLSACHTYCDTVSLCSGSAGREVHRCALTTKTAIELKLRRLDLGTLRDCEQQIQMDKRKLSTLRSGQPPPIQPRSIDPNPSSERCLGF